MSQPEHKFANRPRYNLFALVAGLFVSLALLKFGNPVILDSKIAAPNGFDDWLYSTWPIRWSYWSFLPLIACGLLISRWKTPRNKWLFAMPLIWLVWQFISATQTIHPELTRLTVQHFAACVVCFYLGWFALAEVTNLWLFWSPILVTFLWVIRVGFEQHSSGLQHLKEYITVYVLPLYDQVPKDLLARIEKNRIFGTLIYPNAFAAALLLFTPPLLANIWAWTCRLTLASRSVLVACVGISAAVCLYWTGSKSGWLLALIVGAITLLQFPIARKVKVGLVLIMAVAGLSGFFLKYAVFFQKGATSVVARTDYWRAAVRIFVDHPVFGSGPGTFSILYERIKSPSAEMARLAHNDYLQQASDSGFVGFVAFSASIIGSLALLYRYRTKNPVEFAIWLGLAALALQSFLEFNFYIPALAWPTFLLLGYLLRFVQGEGAEAVRQ